MNTFANQALAVLIKNANVKKEFSNAWSDLRTGAEEDWKKLGRNWDENWEKTRRESPYGNFANIGPLMAAGALIAPAAAYGTYRLGRGMLGGLAGLFRRKGGANVTPG